MLPDGFTPGEPQDFILLWEYKKMPRIQIKDYIGTGKTTWVERPKMTEFRIQEKYDEPFTEPPCDGAFQRLAPRVDIRSVDDPAKLPFPEPWYDKGTNHRVVKGCICRDWDSIPAWFVEIPDIVDFTREHGSCTIHVDIFNQPWIDLVANNG